MPERTIADLRKVLASTYSRLFSPFTLFFLGSSWLVAVLAGPFGTYDHLSILNRTLYWGGIAVFGALIGFGVRAVLLWWTGSEDSFKFSMLAACLLTLIFAPMVIGWRYLMVSYSPELWVSPLLITFNTFVISATIFIMRKLLMPHEDPAGMSAATEQGDVAEVRLVRRLPEDVAGDVLSLTASNHHVEVTTTQGRATLRLRLSDAIGELEGLEGFCIHRSHWVSRNAILEVKRLNAQKIVVVLTNGDELPVSRKYRVNLERAGLFESTKAA